MGNPEETLGRRQRAEAITRADAANATESLLPEETRLTLHELRVHQVELEMQNEELHRAHQELGLSQARYFDLYNMAPVGYCTLTENGLILEINLTATLLLGAARGALVNQPLSRFILPGDQETYYLGRKALFETGEPRACEVQMVKKDGTQFWAHLAAAMARDTDGKPALRVVISDITQRKALEAQLRHAQKMEAVGQLAGGVAHDFNNILAATMMHLSYLQHSPQIDDATKAALGEVLVVAKRGAALTRQLLMFSRKNVMQLRLLNLNDLIAGMLPMLRRYLGEQITVEFQPAEGLPTIEADAGMIDQVVMNLCVNARDAMPRGGRLSIQTLLVRTEPTLPVSSAGTGEFSTVCLVVSDTGCGMDDSVKDHLFEPFFTTKEVGRGTGLGLATVYGIVKQHEGRIAVESVVDQGTTARVFLPAASRQVLQVTPAPESPLPPKGEETILLVEDELALLRVTAKHLRFRGYTILEAATGPEALRVWEQESGRIDLLFSDMIMPDGLSGLDLAEEFRKTRPQLKVIISSGYTRELRGEQAETQARIAFLAKPYDAEGLEIAIRRCLDGA